MTRFVQLHFLTVYPPSNPNRDDLGRPKTAFYGGVHRLRISSQSLKRAARVSPVMSEALKGKMGERTKRMGDEVVQHLRARGADETQARKIAKQVAEIFGTIESKKGKTDPGHVRINELAFISPDERRDAMQMAEQALKGQPLDEKVEPRRAKLLRIADGAVDLAMFGRMLASSPEYNREAAVQVSHAITTHRADVEDDYYTAVDDLKRPAEDSGAAHVDQAEFGSGVYYLYVCVDTDQLVRNLADDRALARKALGAVTEAFATSSPSGKRNSYNHHTRASYVRAECGEQQPRSLAAAFLKPVRGEDLLEQSIRQLQQTAAEIDTAYGASFDESVEMNVPGGHGTLEAVKTFVANGVAHA